MSKGSRGALEILLYSWERAEDAKAPPDQFAVELQRLLKSDVVECDIRWLLRRGHVEHFIEVKLPIQRGRALASTESLGFFPESCFALTPSGLKEARRLRQRQDDANSATSGEVGKSSSHHPQRPRWDKKRRELYVGDILMKRLTRPAQNQQRILDAFEEEGWPSHIDDPLPPRRGIDARRRLHDTINSLNEFEQPGIIKFRGNGGGNGVAWDYVLSTRPAPKKRPRRRK